MQKVKELAEYIKLS